MGKRQKKLELFHGDDDKWYFHEKFTNGEIGTSSQGYKQKRYAMEAIRRDYPDFEVVEVER